MIEPGGPVSSLKTRTNAEWLSQLRGSGDEQAAALEDLRAHLMKAARYALLRSGRLAASGGAAIEPLAEDCAQDALVAILRRLDDFRGDSRFTTWAYSFAVNIALVASRREVWKHVSLDALLERSGDLAWVSIADTGAGDPEHRARCAEALGIVRRVIEEELTDRQRQALKTVAIDGVPLDELVRHWGSSRNAIYKLLHDARQRLKTRLEAHGFKTAEIVELFARSG